MDIRGDSVLVTGASGSMGGSLSIWLAERGASVRALVRSPEKAGFLRDVTGVEIVQGDLTQPASLSKAAQGCRFVFHCGAALSGDLATQTVNNVDGTRNLARAVGQAGVERLVHISTLHVYAGRQGDCSEEMEMIPDDSPYSITKVKAEQALREVASETGLHYSVVRPGAIYGPRGYWTRTFLSFVRRNPVWLVGPGTGVLPPIYMDDLLEECLLCATHPAAAGEAFNAAFAPHPPIERILLAFAALLESRLHISIPAAPFRGLAGLLVAFAPSNNRLKSLKVRLETIAVPKNYSMEKARRLLGWQPRVDIEVGAQKSAGWLRKVGLLE